MSDLITTVLQDARDKGKLSRTDVVLRYLRIKYRLKVSEFVLKKRIDQLLSGSKL
ncbi:MAG: hypothetical protein L7U70_00020 [Flavobacteriales bacterium]|jgi:hypothetical protein|nr:hypothetical protein [Flavobacteriales bacterium]